MKFSFKKILSNYINIIINIVNSFLILMLFFNMRWFIYWRTPKDIVDLELIAEMVVKSAFAIGSIVFLSSFKRKTKN